MKKSFDAEQIARELTVLARERGADHVIVMIAVDEPSTERMGLTDASFYTAWSGAGLAVRGLLEVGVAKVRSLYGAFDNSTKPA